MNKIPDAQLPPPRVSRSPRNAFAQAASTVDPPKESTTSPIPPTPTVPSDAETGEEARRGSKERSKRMEGTRDILLSIPISQKERMEATIAHTQAFTGVKHQQVFIRTAVQRLCEQLEEQYNRGERYALPPADPHL